MEDFPIALISFQDPIMDINFGNNADLDQSTQYEIFI